ncbi:riboflavin transporter FmnP [Kineothrix alysoides]|uniref:Riboflavin transporter FmnP n=1 Tax=Kineothrix alysoides TaxID=1469948 RepID=A0A4V2QBV8_9FIRM|nr:ECF transporter S component [Kineothrix alysoides]TCL57902.1 riboflavin transporter FmnP [Kineothrix alysoides]
MKELMTAVTENLIFVAEFLGIVALMFALAYAYEKVVMKKSGDTGRIFSTRKVAMIGMFSAIAVILMLLEIPLFFAPGFYKLDFSEIPVLIGAFAFGPMAGVTIEFCKILLELLLKGTTTAFVGELANFIIGCSFVLPASIIYLHRKTKKTALIGSVTGTVCMTVFGTAFNAIYLLPKFAQLYGMPLDTIVQMGTAVNPAINSVTTLVIFAVAPLNIIKGASVSAITVLIYKKLSPILKEGHRKTEVRKATKI